MRKVFLVNVAALSVLWASAAHAADVLVVLMQRDGKPDKPEVHYQAVKEGNCAQLVAEFREQAKQGLSIMLTFKAPPEATGKVLEATCILPDGSIGERFKTPDVPAV
jgi:hypothetical protein